MHKPPYLCFILSCLMALLLAGAGCSRQSDQAATSEPGTNAPMLIIPHMSVGQIRAGMPVQELVALLGEPRNKTANAYDYPQLGLAVIPKEGVVLAVIGGDVTGINGAYVKAFKGRTKEGIGVRSTRDELVASFGSPTETTGKPSGLESFKYQDVGITFNLEGGKVYHMIILLDGQEPPPGEQKDDSIKLSIGTPAEASPEKR